MTEHFISLGFFDKSQHAIVRAEFNDAAGRRIRPLKDSNSGISHAAVMVPNELAEITVCQIISVYNEERFLKFRGYSLYCPRGAEEYGFPRVRYVRTERRATRKIRSNDLGAMMQVDHDVPDAMPNEQTDIVL
jgi:hypothetical protein